MVTMLQMSLTLLLSSLVSGYGVSDEKCQDCVTIVTGLAEASMSNQSLTTQMGMILDMICPEAGLGGPDDHPNCEMFTQHHFPDLAQALFPHILTEEICYDDLGFCQSQNRRPKEVTCDSCLSITRLVAGFLGQEDKRVEAVEFLASDFCINGVPEGDMEFCDRYVRTVMPEELKWFAVTVDHSAIGVCGLFFDVC